MKFMQFCVIVAVIGSNGEYHWTPNGYAAGIVALFVSLLATVIVIDSVRSLRWLLRFLQKFNHEKTSGFRAVGQRPVHQLIGEITLDRRRHDNTPGHRLGNAEHRAIQ